MVIEVVRPPLRAGTVSEWQGSLLILRRGEMSITLDTFVLKFGNGVDLWRDLPGVNLMTAAEGQEVGREADEGWPDLALLFQSALQ